MGAVEGGHVHACDRFWVEAIDINRNAVGMGAGQVKRFDAAGGAEIVVRGFGAELVIGERGL